MIQDLIKLINIMTGYMAIVLPTPSVLFNPDLKPEITSSYEAGIDLRLFRTVCHLMWLYIAITAATRYWLFH